MQHKFTTSEPVTQKPLSTVISGLGNSLLANKQIFSFIKEISSNPPASPSLFVSFFVFKTIISLPSLSKDYAESILFVYSLACI